MSDLKYPAIAERLLEMERADLALREQLVSEGTLFDGYNRLMALMHLKNAAALAEIIDEIGYPTADKVGEAAEAAAWLVVQHAVGSPDFMRRCLGLLENLPAPTLANQRQYAYLSDRIAVFEGRPQRYGTQFDWDGAGKLSPQPCDKVSLVDQRREAIGLNSLTEQTAVLRARAEREGERPPTDAPARREAYDAWRRRVGWIG